MLTSYLIQLACSNTSNTDACNKASEAFSKQAGIERSVESFEGWSKGSATHYSKTYLGDETVKYTGLTYTAYHAIVTKSLTLSCPTLGIANTVISETHPDSSKLIIQWNF